MSSAFAFLFPKCVVPLTMLRQHSSSIPSLITATELDFFNFLFVSFFAFFCPFVKNQYFPFEKKININISSLFIFFIDIRGSFISLGVYHSTTIIRKLDLGVSWFLPPQNINPTSFHSPFLGLLQSTQVLKGSHFIWKSFTMMCTELSTYLLVYYAKGV